MPDSSHGSSIFSKNSVDSIVLKRVLKLDTLELPHAERAQAAESNPLQRGGGGKFLDSHYDRFQLATEG